MSQICSLIVFLFILRFLAANSTPMVTSWLLFIFCSISCSTTQDFPTPNSASGYLNHQSRWTWRDNGMRSSRSCFLRNYVKLWNYNQTQCIRSCIQKTKNILQPSVHHFLLASLLKLHHFVVQLLDVTLANLWRTCGLIQATLSLFAQLLGRWSSVFLPELGAARVNCFLVVAGLALLSLLGNIVAWVGNTEKFKVDELLSCS